MGDGGGDREAPQPHPDGHHCRRPHPPDLCNVAPLLPPPGRPLLPPWPRHRCLDLCYLASPRPLLGLPQLGTAFGRLTAVRGVAALASPPLAAMLAEHMAMPLLPLYLSSGLFAASTLLFSIAVLVYDRKMKKYSLYEQI